MIVKDGKAKIAEDIVSSFTKIKIGNGGDATAESQHSLDSVITDGSGAEVTSHLHQYRSSAFGRHGYVYN